jgi:hypothetical protein
MADVQVVEVLPSGIGKRRTTLVDGDSTASRDNAAD